MSNTAPNELRVYVKPGCPWCVSVVSYLRNEAYDFEEIDVLENPDAFEEMKRLSKQSFAPTLTYGKLLLADCGVPELQRWLKANDIRPNR